MTIYRAGIRCSMTGDADARDDGRDRDGSRVPRTWCSTSGPSTPRRTACCGCKLVLDGERVGRAEPIVGYMHRGAEKLFEVRDYRQIIVLANRHDWLSAFANELGVALAVERLMGMEVPERAVWLRTALAELNRVLNHLMFLGSYPLEIGAITPIFYAFRERETIQAVMEEVSGGRMHYMFNRVGGLKEEVPAGWTGRARAGHRRGAPPTARPGQPDPAQRHLPGPYGRRRRAAAPRTPPRTAPPGPVARACGLDFDLRRDEPYLAYGELDVPVVTRTAGDCHARFEVLLDQVYVSLDLAEQCLDRVDQITGPVNVRLPKVVQGAGGAHLRVDRESARHQRLLPGLARREDAVADEAAHRLVRERAGAVDPAAGLPGARTWSPILGSMFFVVGDIDK